MIDTNRAVVLGRGKNHNLYLILRFAGRRWNSSWVQSAPVEATSFADETAAWEGLKKSGCGGPEGYEVITLAEALEIERGAAR